MTQFRRPSPWVIPWTRPARRRRPRGRFSPHLDRLEGRPLLATLTVTNADDAGPGSLRQAILDANAAPGADVVRFDGGLDGATITLSGGPISITDDVAIDGLGASRLAVSGGGVGAIFATSPAVADPSTPPPVVTIEGLTLAHGLASLGGGAISAQQTDLTLEGCVVEDSAADVFGGGLFVFPGIFVDPTTGHDVFVPGALTIDGCTFRDNRVNVEGGAIMIFGTPSTVRDSTFQGNSATFGGAINSRGSDESPASLRVSGSSFLGNSSSSTGIALGGAIFNGGELTVDDSLFAGNQARGERVSVGGAIHNQAFFASLTVTASAFLDNAAVSTDPDSTFAGGGAIGSESNVSMTIDGSRFQGNRAESGFDVFGGAVQSAGTATITDSTFLGNVARGRDAAAGSIGAGTPRGGAVSSSGALTLADSTFLGNQALGGANPTGFAGWAFGGAVSHGTGPMTVTGTLFAGNLARAGDGGQVAGSAAGGGLWLGFGGWPDSTVEDSQFLGNQAVGGDGLGTGAAGGFARGGGLAAVGGRGTLNLRGVVFAGGRALGGRGGPGGAGGDALGGGLEALSATVAVDAGLFVANQAIGGDSPGGPAGSASGGAISSQPDPGHSLTVRATTLLANRARGGSGATGGDARGGGLFASGAATVEDSLVIGNRADAGPAGVGYGGGIFLDPGTTATLRRTRVLGNKATTAGDQIFGSYAP